MLIKQTLWPFLGTFWNLSDFIDNRYLGMKLGSDLIYQHLVLPFLEAVGEQTRSSNNQTIIIPHLSNKPRLYKKRVYRSEF